MHKASKKLTEFQNVILRLETQFRPTLRQGETKYNTRNKVQIFRMIKYIEDFEVTLHTRACLYYNKDLILFT